MQFVHLHNHTEYSAKDGMSRIPDLVNRAAALGMPAVAVTDHGNISGAIELYNAAGAANIKPIIGCEIYCVPDMNRKSDGQVHHLVLLAKDKSGYRNLVQLTTGGYLAGFHRVPRVDLDFISAHSKGLIALTACVAGRVPFMILEGNEGVAKAELGTLQEIFSEDIYIELHDHGLHGQKRLNSELVRLGQELDISALATNDCHYVNADDWEAHEVLVCIRTRKTYTDYSRLSFSSDQYYLKTAEEMAALFPDEYLVRTLEVAEKCNLGKGYNTCRMPQFNTPDGSSPDDYLQTMIERGIQERYSGRLDQKRRDRLTVEYGVIRKTGFASYFLVIADVVQWARDNGIRVGPGRGSAVASLVVYLLGITDVDPVQNDLLFERFLTEDRVSLPDIDVDFSHDRRKEIMEYLKQKYGHASQVISFYRLQPRSTIRAVGKVLGIDSSMVNAAARNIPENDDKTTEGKSKTLEELQYEIPELRDIDPRVIDIGTRLHNVIKHTSRHPGGIVVSDRPLEEQIPLCTSRGMELTQYSKDALEDCDMLKTMPWETNSSRLWVSPWII